MPKGAADNFPPHTVTPRTIGPHSSECTHRFAQPSNHARYFGYYAGGSRLLLGEGRYRQEDGTWGWDYSGIVFNNAAVSGRRQ